MQIITLMDVRRFRPAELVPALRSQVERSGGAVELSQRGEHLRVAIAAPGGLADVIAEGLVNWYREWRQDVRGGTTGARFWHASTPAHPLVGAWD